MKIYALVLLILLKVEAPKEKLHLGRIRRAFEGGLVRVIPRVGDMEDIDDKRREEGRKSTCVKTFKSSLKVVKMDAKLQCQYELIYRGL